MNTQNPNAGLRSKYLSQWKSASGTLLLISLMSLVNIVLHLLNTGYYFLFTAYFPYSLGVAGVSYLQGGNSFDTMVGIFLLSIVAVIMIVYFVCYFLSRKKAGWLIVGTVLFAIDTAFVLYIMLVSGEFAAVLLDMAIHVLALVELGVGIAAAAKLKKLPAQEIVAEAVEVPTDAVSGSGTADFDEIPKQTGDQPGISDEFKK